MSTPESQSAQPDSSPVDPDAGAKEVAGQQTSEDDVSDSLPLPNDPVDASGLLSADDLNGEVTD